MGWRTLIIENGHKISLKLDNIKIEEGDHSYMLPMKDIDTIILNNYKMYMTVQLMCKLSKYNINVIACEKNGMPAIIINPLAGNYSTLKYQQIQLEVSPNTKARLWKEIIYHKINNQIAILDCFTKSMESIDLMDTYKNEIEEDDRTNREGLAAKLYFRALFGDMFIRDHDGEDAINCMLNYGYAIMRSFVARALAAKGLILSLGVKHKNIFNRFNLVDDIMEPFRPIVDYWVYRNLVDAKQEFSRENRQEFVRFLCNLPVLCEGRKCTLQMSISRHVDTLVRLFENDKETLVFPELNTELWSVDDGGL